MTRDEFDALFKLALKKWADSVGTAGLGDCVWAAFYAAFTKAQQQGFTGVGFVDNDGGVKWEPNRGPGDLIPGQLVYVSHLPLLPQSESKS